MPAFLFEVGGRPVTKLIPGGWVLQTWIKKNIIVVYFIIFCFDDDDDIMRDVYDLRHDFVYDLGSLLAQLWHFSGSESHQSV